MGIIMHKGEAFGSSGNSSNLIPTDWETYRALQLAGEVDPDAYYFVNDIDISSLLPTLINEPANNNVLAYDETSGIWKNKMLTADDIPYDENTSVEDELSSLNSALVKVKESGTLSFSGSNHTGSADLATAVNLDKSRIIGIMLIQPTAGLAAYMPAFVYDRSTGNLTCYCTTASFSLSASFLVQYI